MHFPALKFGKGIRLLNSTLGWKKIEPKADLVNKTGHALRRQSPFLSHQCYVCRLPRFPLIILASRINQTRPSLSRGGKIARQRAGCLPSLLTSLSAHLWTDCILEYCLCKFRQCLPGSAQGAKSSEAFCQIHGNMMHGSIPYSRPAEAGLFGVSLPQRKIKA